MADDPLASAHRPIRRIAPPDVPQAGLLATDGDDTVLLIDVDDIDAALWVDDTPDHLWCVSDVARRHGGHDALFPWCTQRLSSFIAERRGEPFTGGEGVTIGVSVLRGHRQAREAWAGASGSVTGDWWLTDAGRPLVVRGDGGGVDDGAITLLRTTAAACADHAVANALSRAVELIGSPQPPARLDDAERHLFSLCAPRPLTVMAARSRADLVAEYTRHTRDEALERHGREPASDLDRRADHGRFRLEVARAVIDDLAAAVRRVIGRGSVRRVPTESAEPRGARERRTRTMFAAAGVGAVVLIVGLAIPQGSDPGSAEVIAPPSPGVTASADTETPSAASPTAAGAAETGEEPDPVERGEDPDPVAIGEALLADIAACRETGAGCAAVVADPETLAAVPTGTPLSLVDDYGGVAVLRASPDTGDVFVVIEERAGTWRVRDVRPAS